MSDPTSIPTPKPVPAPPAQQKRKAHVGFNGLMCLGYTSLIIIIFLLLLALAVAKSGLLTIPVVSRVYRGPQPARIISAGVTDPETFQDTISLKTAMAVRKGKAPPYEVQITETELTAALRGALAGALRGTDVLAERPQIVLNADGMEVSGKLIRKPLTFDLLATFDLAVEGRELVITPSEIQVGDYPIPTSTARQVLGLLFKRDFGTWRLEVGEMGLQDVRLQEGKAILLLQPR